MRDATIFGLGNELFVRFPPELVFVGEFPYCWRQLCTTAVCCANVACCCIINAFVFGPDETLF